MLPLANGRIDDALETGPGRSQVHALLDAARAGKGGGLVVHGGPGIGKSTLLRYAADSAQGFVVLTAEGNDAEADLPFAALQKLLMPLAARISALPKLPAATLERVLLGDPENVPGQLPLGVALLTLLSRTAQRRPVLCCVDDVDLVDPASMDVLAFAARRLAAEKVAMLFVAPDDRPAARRLPGLPTLPLAGLAPSAAAGLADQLLAGEASPDVAVAVAAACAGNPQAIEELTRALSTEQRRGRAELPECLPLHSHVRREYEARVAQLPLPARRMLLLLAADEKLDVATVERVSELAGGSSRALAAAEEAGLIHEVAGVLRFRLPLLRASVYRAAPPAERDAAHRLLAEALASGAPPIRLRRALHLAAVSDTPDVAEELRLAADAVRETGDHASASLAAERVAELTSAPDQLLTAARDAWLAGRPHRAGVLLARLRPARPSPALRGFTELLQGEMELRTGVPAAGAEMLLAAAERLTSDDDESRIAAMTALLHAGEVSFFAGDQKRYLDVVRRVLALRRAEEPPEAELMFEFCTGMAAIFDRRPARATQPLRRVLELAPRHDDPTLLTLASLAACVLGQESRGFSLATRAKTAAEVRGELAIVPRTLELSSYAQLWLGRHQGALASAVEGLRLAEEFGQATSVSFHLATLALLAVPRGDEETCAVRARAAIAQADQRGAGMSVALAHWALAGLDLTLGRTAEAASRLGVLVSDAGLGRSHLLVRMMAAPHFVEAALRCGDRKTAAGAARLFDTWASHTGSPAPMALAARSRALLAGDPQVAEENFQEAMRLHLLGDHEFERARTELLYGHELRRRRGSLAARGLLHSALETFERLEAHPWSRLCQGELRAAGEAVRMPTPDQRPGPENLTPQQRQIAQLAAQGATNREIAAQLYLSTRTVDHHMRNIFVRLGVRSRVELVRLMA